MLEAGALKRLWKTPPGNIALFLRALADAIEENRAALVDLANEDTCYAHEPRLPCIESASAFGSR